MRSVPFLQITTTLLAVVDASMGWETEIDHPMWKNIIGLLYQPVFVVVDAASLVTPARARVVDGGEDERAAAHVVFTRFKTRV